MTTTAKNSQIRIPAGTQPWPHELRVANILASAGHDIEFLAVSAHKTADILLDGIEFEIKSPRTDKINSLEHLVKRALRQSPNIIIDGLYFAGEIIDVDGYTPVTPPDYRISAILSTKKGDVDVYGIKKIGAI